MITQNFGSLRDLHYQLNLSKRLGFLPKEDSSLIETKVVETENCFGSGKETDQIIYTINLAMFGFLGNGSKLSDCKLPNK